ncbi:FxsA family protein [Mycobacteroides franklinii]|uniref:Membrane protein FxsA n=1 Tax=Mycobacteroides franklinii TaxID=948102 RepID=A0A4R8R9H3_9MYCO|nr:FxsA family protein [Mycobacteroides franklinii]ORA58160.1 membrane protein FxsA [Mycobacteroides franklinii]TDH20781.1 membrane protein FxsA [Mycobacteroides franklinii]TDZ42733.1 phage T7 F exclusion suppressor FxsA [Mycobacteroides franklinii]TDZ52881.1 phage T7 F exclusion suppressor FxsA [Mycobacteroides franklinii]TDZ56288.1 phage T7 F exclusion suppressor FxsA [Mycobacteroides franklinii]
MWPGLFLLYVIVEVSALVALTSAVGIGWTIIAVAAAFVVGLLLAGSQARRALDQLRRGVRSPGGAIADGALIALGSVAVVIPGLVSSAIGLLLLLPPTRAVLRPVLTLVAARQLSRRAPLVTVIPSGFGAFQTGRPRARTVDYIDGEVIDVADESSAQTFRYRPGHDLPA